MKWRDFYMTYGPAAQVAVAGRQYKGRFPLPEFTGRELG